MRLRSKATAMLLGLGALCVTASGGNAQSYPNKPVTFVLGFSPGGPSDVLARILCKRLEETLKQPFVIENKTGAGGGIAAAHVARQPADGYTLVLAAKSMLAGNQFVYKQINYDPVKDFEAVSIVGLQPNIIFVTPTVPAKTLQEFVAYAKANPGKLNYGTGGVGTTSHFAAEQFRRSAGIEITHVPHRGTGMVIQAVVGAHVQIGVNPPAPLVPLIKGGEIRALATTGPKRTGALPELPTVAEQGYPGYEFIEWHGVMGPAGMPKEVVTTLHMAITDALKDEGIKKQLTELGVDVWGSTPEEFRKQITDDIPKVEEAARLSGVKREQ